MTSDETLQLLAHLCQTSVASALRELGIDAETGAPELVQQGASPFAAAPAPGIEARVELDGGLAGEVVLLASDEAAAALAELVGEGQDAVDRVALHVATAIAAAAGGILGQDVPVGEPATQRYERPEEAGATSDKPPHAFAIPLSIGGAPALLVRSVQNAFLIKAAPALGDIADQSEAAAGTGDAVPEDALRDIKVRVWAELGRARLPLAQAVSIPSGAVVQLDRGADDPVELFVNGRLFALGRLVVRDDEWAVEIAELVSGLRPEVVALVDGQAQPVEAATDNSPR